MRHDDIETSDNSNWYFSIENLKNIIQRERLHLFYLQSVQTLQAGDHQQILEFCLFILDSVVGDSDFVENVFRKVHLKSALSLPVAVAKAV